MVPYDTEGDADSLTAQCIQIRAFSVQGRQTVHLNYRSPQISRLKINELKTAKHVQHKHRRIYEIYKKRFTDCDADMHLCLQYMAQR